MSTYSEDKYAGTLHRSESVARATICNLRLQADEDNEFSIVDGTFKITFTDDSEYETKISNDFGHFELSNNFKDAFCLGVYDCNNSVESELSLNNGKMTYFDLSPVPTPPDFNLTDKSIESGLYAINLLVGSDAETPHGTYGGHNYLEIITNDTANCTTPPVDENMFYDLAPTLTDESDPATVDDNITLDDLWKDFKEDKTSYTPPTVTPYDQTIVILPPNAYNSWDNQTIYYYVYGVNGAGSVDNPLSKKSKNAYVFNTETHQYLIQGDNKGYASVDNSFFTWVDSNNDKHIGRLACDGTSSIRLNAAYVQYILSAPAQPSDFTTKNYLIVCPPAEVDGEHQIANELVPVTSNNIYIEFYKSGTLYATKKIDISTYVTDYKSLSYNINTHCYIITTKSGTFTTNLPNSVIESTGVKADSSVTSYSTYTNTYQLFKIYVFDSTTNKFNTLNVKGIHATKDYTATNIEHADSDNENNTSTAASNEEFVTQNKSLLMTPAEYYSEHSTAMIDTDEAKGYDRKEQSNLINGVPKYFWVETLKNWCIFRKVSETNYRFRYYNKSISIIEDAKNAYTRRAWEMYIWNGMGGWINFNKLCENCFTHPDTNQQLSLYEAGKDLHLATETSMTTQYYDMSRFKFISNLRIDAIGNSTEKYWTAIKQRTPTWLVARGIILTNDRDYSVIDSVSCQPIRISKTYARYHNCSNGYDDKWHVGQQCYTTGCPMIWRLPSGELFLASDWQVDGNFDNDDLKHTEVLNESATDFINQAARAFFGEGSDKTIDKDWRNFKYHDSIEEHASAFLTSDSDDTLLPGKDAYLEFYEFTDSATIKVKTNRSRVSGTSKPDAINTITRW